MSITIKIVYLCLYFFIQGVENDAVVEHNYITAKDGTYFLLLF